MKNQNEVVENDNQGVSVGNYERALIMGDLSKLSESECESYYLQTCKSIGVNPLTKPFEYLIFQGQKRLYMTKSGAEQIRAINGVSVVSCTRNIDKELGMLEVTATVRDKSGREDIATACVVINDKTQGEALCLAVMKAETKAKRRATLSLCGLGYFENEPDELEIAERVGRNEITNNSTITPLYIAELAHRKGVALEKIINHFGKSDIIELSNDELRFAEKKLNDKPDIAEVVA